jgi:hypothetical protein
MVGKGKSDNQYESMDCGHMFVSTFTLPPTQAAIFGPHLYNPSGREVTEAEVEEEERERKNSCLYILPAKPKDRVYTSLQPMT